MEQLTNGLSAAGELMPRCSGVYNFNDWDLSRRTQPRTPRTPNFPTPTSSGTQRHTPRTPYSPNPIK
ncbi:hypothetical protein Pmani_034425 [Petrolisthes manimaculis]|uniref:Uncharacterized protein n=1 Tax=Petrolisthes manimaculis TaxID=1843537 RepID=A0AAE1TPF0_9EUCA|nr:hypothetical protein Pmani_034425 [Petrolisthes manimaculis]